MSYLVDESWLDVTKRLVVRGYLPNNRLVIVDCLEELAESGDLGLAMLSMVDTLLSELGDEAPQPGFGLGFQDVDSGEVGFADDVPPHVAWAGRMVMARVNDDKEQWDALILAMPDTEWMQYAHSLFSACMLQISEARARRS